MIPQEYKILRDTLNHITDNITKVLDAAKNDAGKCPLPENLRPATPSDIIEGAIIWYKHGDDGHFWQIVEEVLWPEDPWKAYCAMDGCRYGLDDSWVEVVK
jgi:hypothetical protein